MMARREHPMSFLTDRSNDPRALPNSTAWPANSDPRGAYMEDWSRRPEQLGELHSQPGAGVHVVGGKAVSVGEIPITKRAFGVASGIFVPFISLSKADRDERIVVGYASTDRLDLQGERVSLSALKRSLPDYQRWNNIRYMHQPHVIGTAEHTAVDERGLLIRAKISDASAWEAVKDGRLKGFSIGGECLSKQGDTITDLRLLEISLVDRPANPDCAIESFKALYT
jgi:HK97 family phage prohead protease